MHLSIAALPTFLVLLNQVSAAPLADITDLLKRDYTGFDGCSNDQKDKINHALSDAAVLARFVKVKHGDQTFKSSSAFTNYFQDVEDDTGVEDMYAAIGVQASAPAKPINGEPEGSVTLNQFKVHITCNDPDKLCKQKGTASLAITDVSPVSDSFTPSILFCPAFFDKNEARTKNNLDSLPYLKNPGRRDASWCKTNEKFKYFEVAGHTVLHELTHLNEAGSRAHLAPRPADPSKPQGDMTQGTDDIYGTKGYSTDPMTAARQLHANWKKIIDANPTPPKDTWPPYVEKLNAESYAAAALEWWFMSQCDFPSILPN